MKLDSVFIDKFGGYSNASIDSINPGFTLFYGQNESGKTTLKNFFNQMLFGFAKKNAKFETQYIPFDGTTISGKLSFILANGNKYRLSRTGNKTNLIFPDNSILNSEPMPILWNSITKETFKQVFCMDIQDWNGLSLMDKEEMQNRFLSSSLGLNSLINSTKQLKINMDNLWKKHGRTQVIYDICKKLKTIDKEIKDQEKLITEYNQWGQELLELETILGSLSNQKKEAESSYNKKLALNDMKSDWIECKKIDHQRKPLKHEFSTLHFSSTLIEKAEKLDDEIKSLEKKLELEQSNLDRLTLQNTSIDLEEELLLKQEEINSLVEKKNQFVEAIQIQPKLYNEIESEKIEFIETLKTIDPTWDKEILKKICIPIDQKSFIKLWEKDENEIISEIKVIKNETQKVKEEIESKSLKIQNLFIQIKNTKLLTNDEFYLATNTIKTLSNFESHRILIKENQWKTKNSLNKNYNLPFGILVLGIVLLTIGIIGANINIIAIVSTQIKKGLIFLDLIGFILILVFFYFKHYSKKSFQDTSLKDLNEEIRKYCEGNPFVKDKYKTLRLNDLVIFLQKKLASHSEKSSTIQQIKVAISTINSDIETLNSLLSRNEEKLSLLIKKGESLRYNWTLWKLDHYIQNNFSLSDYDSLFTEIEKAQSKLKVLVKSESRLNDLKNFILTTKNQIKQISSAMKHTKNITVFTPETISSLQLKLSENLDKKRKKILLSEKIQSIYEQLGEITLNLGIKKEQLTKIFFETKTNTLVELENKTDSWISYRKLDELYSQHMNRIYGKISNDEIWDKMIKELDSLDFDENFSVLKKLEEESIQIDEGIAKALEKKGELNQKRESIDTVAKIGKALQDKAFLKSEFRNNAENWFSNAIALRMIQETKSCFEKSQQPEIIKFASSWIQTITSNRYSLMKTGESKKSHESFILIDQLTSKKTEKEWSGGLSDQVYLSIRMGLINELSKHGETLPIFLDDILIRFDQERQLKTAELLLSFSKKHQLLYFSCHPKILSLFRSIENNSSNPTSSFYNIDKFTISQI